MSAIPKTNLIHIDWVDDAIATSLTGLPNWAAAAPLGEFRIYSRVGNMFPDVSGINPIDLNPAFAPLDGLLSFEWRVLAFEDKYVQIELEVVGFPAGVLPGDAGNYTSLVFLPHPGDLIAMFRENSALWDDLKWHPQ